MMKTLKFIAWAVAIYLVGGVLIFVVKFDRRCERIFIPDDYRGIFMVVHKHPLGDSKEYKNWCREYRIPDDGIFVTKFKSNPGWMQNEHNIRMFLTDTLGREIEEAKWLHTGLSNMQIDSQRIYFKFMGYSSRSTFRLKSFSYGLYAIDTGAKIKFHGSPSEIEQALLKAEEKLLGNKYKLPK